MKKTILTTVVISFSIMGLLAQTTTSANTERKQVGQFKWTPLLQSSIIWDNVIIDDYIRLFLPDENKPFFMNGNYEDYGNVIPIAPSDSVSTKPEPIIDEPMFYRHRVGEPVLNDVIDVEHQIK